MVCKELSSSSFKNINESYYKHGNKLIILEIWKLSYMPEKDKWILL